MRAHAPTATSKNEMTAERAREVLQEWVPDAVAGDPRAAARVDAGG